MKKEKTRERSRSLLPESNQDQEQRAAWIAVRCAAAVGQAMRARTLLAGDPSITAAGIGTKAQQDMPDFLMLDLVGSYILGERKRLYKSESSQGVTLNTAQANLNKDLLLVLCGFLYIP